MGDKPHKLPPDPGGLFESAASRAKKVLAIYDELYPEAGGVEGGFLVTNLLHDLMHLCDREPKLGNFHQKYAEAVGVCQDLLAENMWTLGWYDDFETAERAAERMMFGESAT